MAHSIQRWLDRLGGTWIDDRWGWLIWSREWLIRLVGMAHANITCGFLHMMMSSFGKLAEDTATASLVDQILSFIHSFLSQWLPFVLGHGNNAANHVLRKTMKELLHVHCDLIVDLQRSHPIAFVRYLKPFLEIFHSSLMYNIVGVVPKEANTVSTKINNMQSTPLHSFPFLPMWLELPSIRDQMLPTMN